MPGPKFGMVSPDRTLWFLRHCDFLSWIDQQVVVMTLDHE